jgi:hypothetical protein
MSSQAAAAPSYTREQLIHHLTEAAELEHNILCSYLYAAFSLKLSDASLSEAEAAAVHRWHRLIIGVAVEEMGHLAIVNNLLVAIGGAPHFDRPNLPVSEGYLPSCFHIQLAPFDERTLDHFIFLERPQSSDEAAEALETRRLAELKTTPSAEDYSSIAELYDHIRLGFEELVKRQGNNAFQTGAVGRQITPSVVDLKGVEEVADLRSALAGLDLIVEQGEGSSTSSQTSHFASFCRIKEEWAELKTRNPVFAPAHPVARDPVMRRPQDGKVRAWIRDPQAVVHLDLANAVYGQMLIILEQVYVGGLLSHRKVLCSVAMRLMKTLSLLGAGLARMPAGPHLPGVNAGLTFAVPRNLGARGTHYLGLALERIMELRDRYAQLGACEDTELARACFELQSAMEKQAAALAKEKRL